MREECMLFGVDTDGIVKQKEALDQLMMSNPEMEKRVQKLVRTVLTAARREVSKDAQRYMKSDPRKAYKAVKSMVYRRILGGNISILNKRRAGQRLSPPPVVHQLETRVNSKGNHRGGNRMPRSRRTEDLLTYSGADRAFILRFLNAGTSSRESRVGTRGAIAPRNLFSDSSHKAMQQAAQKLDKMIEELIEKEMR